MNLESRFDVRELDQYFKNWAGIELVVYRICDRLLLSLSLSVCNLPVLQIRNPRPPLNRLMHYCQHGETLNWLFQALHIAPLQIVSGGWKYFEISGRNLILSFK